MINDLESLVKILPSSSAILLAVKVNKIASGKSVINVSNTFEKSVGPLVASMGFPTPPSIV